MDQKYSISACIITLNEESRIRDCLESVKWANEIIVVDSFSTDKTVDICREYSNRVYQREWPGNIDQKNYTISLAKNDWILSLDADERLSPGLIEEIQDAIRNPRNVAGFFFPRHSFYLGRWIYHGDWYPDYQLRLFKKGCGQWQGTNPHGRVIVDGKTKHMKHDIYHYNYKNFSHQLRTMDNYSNIFADVTVERGKGFSLFQLIFRPFYKFIKVYFIKMGFLDGLPGFILAVSNAFYIFVKYVKLWEKKHHTMPESTTQKNHKNCR
ncbi:MAG TPA: glycosyltransferase family 2 protein [Candidatus Wunengus sp. YC60]|uniref:glycosyltransferase family 2 protein n=1 Tax=Candidatus Wunengus sp. YC60 TaxID=3367697 RepID=UPI004027F2A0